MFEFMRSQINAKRCRSAWDRGVKEYALEIIDGIEECATYEGELPGNVNECLRYALNGAMDWAQYSEGGCSLVYNRQIAERLCTPSELRKTQNGVKDPNPLETWIECQTRALYQAWRKVESAFAAFQQITRGAMKMTDIFHRFETSSRAEREEMAENLKAHYNHMIQLEREAFAALLRKGHKPGIIIRNPGHAEIMAALGHVQAVFDILGIEYEPGQPFDLGLF